MRPRCIHRGNEQHTKSICPRLFDAFVPLFYIWRFDGDESQSQCIRSIADGLYQLGRG